MDLVRVRKAARSAAMDGARRRGLDDVASASEIASLVRGGPAERWDGRGDRRPGSAHGDVD